MNPYRSLSRSLKIARLVSVGDAPVRAPGAWAWP